MDIKIEPQEETADGAQNVFYQQKSTSSNSNEFNMYNATVKQEEFCDVSVQEDIPANSNKIKPEDDNQWRGYKNEISEDSSQIKIENNYVNQCLSFEQTMSNNQGVSIESYNIKPEEDIQNRNRRVKIENFNEPSSYPAHSFAELPPTGVESDPPSLNLPNAQSTTRFFEIPIEKAVTVKKRIPKDKQLKNNHRKHKRPRKVYHSDVKPYECDQCQYKSARFDHLNRHKTLHTGEKPFKCDVCDHQSAESYLLKRHKLSHTGEKPLKCDQCDFKSAYPSNLKKHKRTHVGKKPITGKKIRRQKLGC